MRTILNERRFQMPSSLSIRTSQHDQSDVSWTKDSLAPATSRTSAALRVAPDITRIDTSVPEMGSRPKRGDKNKHSVAGKRGERIQEIQADLQTVFREEIGQFLATYRIDQTPAFAIVPNDKAARPLHVLTGASFIPYCPSEHGRKPSHALFKDTAGNDYLLNNTAALAVRLLDRNHRVLLHSKSPDSTAKLLIDLYPGQVAVVGGDLCARDSLAGIYDGIVKFSRKAPISEVKLALYNSFAQSSGEPFKPMHVETAAEVETAAARRVRFIYGMTALAYDLLLNRGQDKLRIVSFSALASKRPSYGLLADAADKAICDLAWRTFHIEANAHVGKPVTVIQLNPGIIACGDVYEGSMKKLVQRESVADGFPMSDGVLKGKRDLPQLSAHDVALVAERLLTTPEDSNPNTGLPKRIRGMLNANRDSADALRAALQAEIQTTAHGLQVGTRGTLPEYVFSSHTVFGELPKIAPGIYRRVMLTPRGQSF